uniref:Uncharacterized protein n=1 Tax=Siphoviridae sp. ctQLz13 TaxID=2825492 RepID=A0A8S5NUQ4_9CAUD|nr:MAG TPA: hypothetical protein [Siphoviridae sp. ctQLz13]
MLLNETTKGKNFRYRNSNYRILKIITPIML